MERGDPKLYMALNKHTSGVYFFKFIGGLQQLPFVSRVTKWAIPDNNKPPYRGQIIFLFFNQEFHDSLHEKCVEFLIQLQKNMDFQVLVLAAPIEDNKIFVQEIMEFQAHFFIKLSENPRILEACL